MSANSDSAVKKVIVTAFGGLLTALLIHYFVPKDSEKTAKLRPEVPAGPSQGNEDDLVHARNLFVVINTKPRPD